MNGLAKRATAAVWLVLVAATAQAQLADRPAALPPAEIEQLSASAAAQLENARRFLSEHQWSEAVEAIRRVQEEEPTRLVKVDLASTTPRFSRGFERLVPASDYCQWRLMALAGEAPEALAHYRRLVDGLAESWLRAGERNNDERMLARVVEQALASSFGDDALLKLGDLALARGDAGSARGYWKRISPALSGAGAADSDPVLVAGRASGDYADTDLDVAAVQARLVLASIFAGHRALAIRELAALRERFPQSRGVLGGREGPYGELLQDLLDESAHWFPPRTSPDWPTFGGDDARGKRSVGARALAAQPLWSYPLPRLLAGRDQIGEGRLRPAEDHRGLLSYHPIVVNETVYVRMDVQGSSRIVALALQTGETLWQIDEERGLTTSSSLPRDLREPPAAGSDAHDDLGRHLGVARFTLTACGPKLFARVGSPVTVPGSRRAARWLEKDQGFLIGLDLRRQGRSLEGFPIRPPSSEWTFEGTPLCDGSAIYVAMRRVEGARSQLSLAAFELQTTPVAAADDQQATRPTGRLKWRTRIASSATAGGGEIDQLTHLLVTQNGGRLYLNTSAGAVAAVSASDGRLLWLVRYPRTGVRTDHPDEPEQHLFRDLVPCLAWRDLVFVAPADCNQVFALHALTGELVWALPPGAMDDAIHLLGVCGETLIASGNSLYWIDANRGRVLQQFPPGRLGGFEQSAPSPRGYGRGIVVDDQVWWPTREKLLVFDGQPLPTDFGWQPRRVGELSLIDRGATGGNLVLSGGVLLIAGGDKLAAFGLQSEP